MSRRITRIDAFWHAHPALGAAAVVAGLAAYGALTRGSLGAAAAAGAVFALAVLSMAKPTLTAVFAVLGLAGGAASFLLAARPGLSLGLRLLSTLFYGFLYAVLLDATVLAAAALYNALVGRVGLEPLSVETGD